MDTAEILSSFSSSYVEARSKFLEAAECSGLSVENRRNPKAQGVNGENLFTDIVRIGRPDASKALLLISGTHGIEGYCGSGAQIALLKSDIFDQLPDDLSVVMIHAMNPCGFSHDRRVTENNVDLNRNFIDFDAAARPHSDYSKIHDALVPRDWDGRGRAQADEKLASFIAKNGMLSFQAAVSSGQYNYPNGLFYGGDRPEWSNTTLRSIARDYLANVRELGVIDFHTGLGPYGYGELIAIGTEEQKARVENWYGDQVTDPEKGTSSSAVLQGMLAQGLCETLPTANIGFVTLEFGTLPIDHVLTALRGDNWLYQPANFASPLRAVIKQDIRDAFYLDTDDWKHSVLSRSADVVQMALRSLS